MTDNIHYSLSAIDGYQAIFRIIMGARGVGKTFAVKEKAMHLKEGQTCMWTRRYENELSKCMDTFSQDLVKERGYAADDFKLDGEVLYYQDIPRVHFQAMSLADKIKSSSYPDVNFGVYDEFVIKRGRITYLPDEAQAFLDLYSTVFRDRPGVFYLMANNISFINPIFLNDGFNVSDFDGRFKIFGPRDPVTGKTIIDDVTGQPYVVVEKYDNPAFVDHMKKTKFGRFESHIQYGQYALENQSLMDSDSFICPIPSGAHRLCNIRIGVNYIGMYHAKIDHTYVYYFDDSYNSEQSTFAPRQGLKDGEKILLRSDYPINAFAKWQGGLYYKNRKTKGIVEDIINTNYFK